MESSYREFSQIYDLLMDDIDYGKWASYIMEKIKGNGKILEAACGTGSITKILAENNYRVTAFDLSSDMLMRAYEKLGINSGVRFLNLDMTDFSIEDKFDCAICCCDGVNYLTKDQSSLFFKNIYMHLNDKGRFIFDISTEYKYEEMFNDTYVYDSGDVFYVWENVLDEAEKYVSMEINFFVKDINDKYERITEVQTQYLHSVRELCSMLKYAGFENIEVYDDYSMKDVQRTSLRAVFCAEKL